MTGVTGTGGDGAGLRLLPEQAPASAVAAAKAGREQADGKGCHAGIP